MSFGTRTHNEFNTALQTFVEGCRVKSPSDYVFTVEWLQKRIRVVRSYDGTNQRSVHCFVDMATGDVLKAGSWKAPAPNGRRGNIYDASGLKAMDRYGCAYLR